MAFNSWGFDENINPPCFTMLTVFPKEVSEITKQKRTASKKGTFCTFTYNDGRKQHNDSMFDHCTHQMKKKSTPQGLWCCFFSQTLPVNYYSTPPKSDKKKNVKDSTK